jgi:hypothetical protein
MLGWEFYCVCVAVQLVSSANKQSICKRCVADPDLGSGAFFYPWIRDRDPG